MIDQNTAIKIMKDRGYESTSHTQSGDEITTVNFIKHITDEVAIHAKVKLKSETLSLYFVELKYFCQLSATDFDLHHKDFGKYEQIITMYAAKCLDIDVFAVLDSLKPKVSDLKERKRKLWDKIVVEGKKKGYGKDMCFAFYNHWTEMNEGGKKLRFEMEKVFDVSKRLITWLSNEKKWSKTFVDKKVEKQDKIGSTVQKIKTKDLF